MGRRGEGGREGQQIFFIEPSTGVGSECVVPLFQLQIRYMAAAGARCRHMIHQGIRNITAYCICGIHRLLNSAIGSELTEEHGGSIHTYFFGVFSH